jgi:hypothetical protein
MLLVRQRWGLPIAGNASPHLNMRFLNSRRVCVPSLATRGCLSSATMSARYLRTRQRCIHYIQTIFTPKPHRLMRTGCQLAAVPKVHPAADSCRHACSKCLGVQAHLFSSRSMCSSGRGSAVDLKLMGRVASYNVKVWKLVSRIKLAICSTASPTLVVMSYATWSIQQQRAYADELTPKPQNIQLATAVTCGCPNSHPNRHAEPGGYCVWPECLRCCSTVAVALTSSNVSSRKKMIVVSLLPPMCALISSTDGSCSTHPHTHTSRVKPLHKQAHPGELVTSSCCCLLDMPSVLTFQWTHKHLQHYCNNSPLLVSHL